MSKDLFESFESTSVVQPTKHSIEIDNHHQVGIGKAHSKIILMGEHAVVYDYPAIAIPFPAVQVKSTARHSKHGYTELDCQYFKGDISMAPSILLNIVKAVELTLEMFELGQPQLSIKIESNIPQERGMGSSAAVTVSVVRAVTHLFDLTISDNQLHYIVNQAEVIAHQATSGIDTLMTSTNDPVIYRKSQAPYSFKLKVPAYLVVADSGQAGQTRSAVQHVADLRKRKSQFVDQSMRAIGQFVQQAYVAIAEKNVIELGRLMTYNHYYLNQLGVSNTHLDKIVNAAWMAGALGAKLTGGGRGGCLIALAESKQMAKKIAQAMHEAGAVQTWYLNLEN